MFEIPGGAFRKEAGIGSVAETPRRGGRIGLSYGTCSQCSKIYQLLSIVGLRGIGSRSTPRPEEMLRLKRRAEIARIVQQVHRVNFRNVVNRCTCGTDEDQKVLANQVEIDFRMADALLDSIGAGWYPDAESISGYRYWDGRTWTEMRQDANGRPIAQPGFQRPAESSHLMISRWINRFRGLARDSLNDQERNRHLQQLIELHREGVLDDAQLAAAKKKLFMN